MADPQVFQFVGQTIQNAQNSFVTPGAANLMGSLKTLATAGVTLYMVMTGYAIATGAVQAPVPSLIKLWVKIVFIAGIALTADFYTTDVMGAFDGLETGIMTALGVTNGISTNIYQVFDQSLGHALDIVGTCFQHANAAGWHIGSALGWVVAGIIVALGSVIMLLLGGAVVIVAKFMAGIVFAMGPLFILSLMFPITARFFDSWVGQVLNYTFTVVIMGVIMLFAMKAFDTFVAAADFDGAGAANPIYAALEILALTGVMTWIILQAGGMASGLAGGVSAAAMTLRHMTMPASMLREAGSKARNLVDPMSTRRDLESGMMVTARRANHLVAGNTSLNPAYRQHVMENMFKNWGRARGGSASQSE